MKVKILGFLFWLEAPNLKPWLWYIASCRHGNIGSHLRDSISNWWIKFRLAATAPCVRSARDWQTAYQSLVSAATSIAAYQIAQRHIIVTALTL